MEAYVNLTNEPVLQIHICLFLILNNALPSMNQNGKTLKQLNMFGCSRPMDSYMDKTQFFEPFIHNCDVLTELNLQNVYCSDYSNVYLLSNLTVNIRKLNICGMNINDHQFKVLVTRCHKITELNLKISNESVNNILPYLQSTLEKLSFCGRIDLFKMFEKTQAFGVERLQWKWYQYCEKETPQHWNCPKFEKCHCIRQWISEIKLFNF